MSGKTDVVEILFFLGCTRADVAWLCCQTQRWRLCNAKDIFNSSKMPGSYSHFQFDTHHACMLKQRLNYIIGPVFVTPCGIQKSNAIEPKPLCSEIGSLMSVDAPELNYASGDVREPVGPVRITSWYPNSMEAVWLATQLYPVSLVRWAERTPSWLVLFDLQIFSSGVYHPRATSRTIFFSISNSFWY